jgi:hypothetical protein
MEIEKGKGNKNFGFQKIFFFEMERFENERERIRCGCFQLRISGSAFLSVFICKGDRSGIYLQYTDLAIEG